MKFKYDYLLTRHLHSVLIWHVIHGGDVFVVDNPVLLFDQLFYECCHLFSHRVQRYALVLLASKEILRQNKEKPTRKYHRL